MTSKIAAKTAASAAQADVDSRLSAVEAAMADLRALVLPVLAADAAAKLPALRHERNMAQQAVAIAARDLVGPMKAEYGTSPAYAVGAAARHAAAQARADALANEVTRLEAVVAEAETAKGISK